jgi:dUTP pyrophosphatase
MELEATIDIRDSRATIPARATTGSVGLDVAVVSLHKEIADHLRLYDTGFKLQPPAGWYFELVGRSSLPLKGFALANSVGIIDPDYTGNLLVALHKHSAATPWPTLPFTCCQLILRPLLPLVRFREGTIVRQEENARVGGFGSTNK